MQITIDTHVDSPDAIRRAVALLLADIGDVSMTLDAGAPPPPPPPWATEGLPTDPPPPPPPLTLPAAPSAGTAPAFTSTGAESPSAASVPAPMVAAAPPIVPAPSAAPEATSVATSLFDSAGLPWDSRIHQSGKARKKDGTWKVKKGADPALVTSVVQELTAKKLAAVLPGSGSQIEIEIPAPPAPVLLPPSVPATAGSVPVPAQSDNGAGLVPAVSSVPAPSAPVAVPVSPAPAVGVVSGGLTFRDIMAKLTAARDGGKISAAEINTLCQQAGAPNLPGLMGRPDLIALVDDLLTARLLTT